MWQDAGCQCRFQALYSAEWKWREEQFADGEDSQKPISNHLPKVDPVTQQSRLKYWEDLLTKLDAIPREQLSPQEQINYDIYRPQIQVLIANQRFRDFEMPANADTTFWTDLGYTARRPYRTLQDYKNWIAQMRDVPRYFHEQMDEMRAGLKRGLTPPRVTMEGVTVPSQLSRMSLRKRACSIPLSKTCRAYRPPIRPRCAQRLLRPFAMSCSLRMSGC